jgi:hypothetical protein
MSAPPKLMEAAEAVAKELNFGRQAPAVKLVVGGLGRFAMSR